MQPRRPVFAASYIGQAVEGYARVAASGDAVLNVWAGDVLNLYFDVTEPATATAGARERFATITRSGGRHGDAQIPYRLAKTPPFAIDAMRRLATNRRSVRWFTGDRVPRELVSQAMEVALLSPSACNRQPFAFYAFDEPEKIRAVASIPAGTKGFADTIPLLIAVVGELDAFALESDRHLIYTDGALAAMSFMFALETLGLSSCSINWPSSAKHDQAFQALLGASPSQRVVMLIAVGYQDEARHVARSTKRPVDMMLRFNPALRLPSS
jgi:nitroreductase